MKKLFFILVLCIANQIVAQKILNLDFGSGLLLIKNNSGYDFDLGISYTLSQRTAIFGNYNYSNINIININNNSILNRFQFGGYYKLINSSTQISSIVGFSILFSEDNLILDRKTTLGADLGLLILFDADKNFNYGIKLINTFSPSSNGGLMQANICFNNKL